jgi:hypothetical protein
MFENLQTHRQILFDLTANYLDPLPGPFDRLAYLSGLREVSSGKYVHERLATVYGRERVDQVAAACHEEVFERLLEMPLSSQEQALRRYVESLSGTSAEKVENCGQLAASWVPPKSPSYLTELYSSNLSALLELLADSTTKVRPGK